MVLSEFNRKMITIPQPRSFHRLLAFAAGVFTLTIALLAPLQTASAQGADTCFTGGAVLDAANNPGLVSDCEALLAARDILAGSATLDWSASTPIDQWDGVNSFGSPLRVTS